MVVVAVNVLMCAGAGVLLQVARRATEVKGSMGDDARAEFFVHAHRAAEMIRVGMGDDDGVDVLGFQVCLPKALKDGLPGALTR